MLFCFALEYLFLQDTIKDYIEDFCDSIRKSNSMDEDDNMTLKDSLTAIPDDFDCSSDKKTLLCH